MRRLETHYRDLCDIEFTVERGKLWMLQTRVGKRTAPAAFRIAYQLVDEHLITMDEALTRVTGAQLSQLLFPQFDPTTPSACCSPSGMAASPGAAVGMAVFDSATASAWAAEGKDVILVRRETNPDDLGGMIAAVGVLTARGGKTSHAAVVARGMGRTCVVGAEALDIDTETRSMNGAGPHGPRGRRHRDRRHDRRGLPRRRPGASPRPCSRYLEDGLEVALAEAPDDETARARRAVDRILRHADATRRLRVHANADTAEDAERARRLGAAGHRPVPHRAHVPRRAPRCSSSGSSWRPTTTSGRRRSTRCCRCSARTSSGSCEAMDGLPTTIRLLDPPLHEFLPDLTELSVKVALAEASAARSTSTTSTLLAAVRRMHEANPMLGLRGVRLGLVIPGLFALQIRAVCEAVAAAARRRRRPARRRSWSRSSARCRSCGSCASEAAGDHGRGRAEQGVSGSTCRSAA